MDRSRRALIACLAAGMLLVGLLAMTSSATAAVGPVWRIVSVSSPTNLAPDTPRDEVQGVVVNATAGTFKLAVSSRLCSAREVTGPISYNAGAGEVQSALEALSCAGHVTVSGGPGGSNPYVVTFVGEQGNQPVALMSADSSALTGGSATVSEVVRGAFVPYLVVRAINVGGSATDGSVITFTDSLPSSLTATALSGFDAYASGFAAEGVGGAPMSCSGPPTVSCSYSGTVDPGDTLVMKITLKVVASAPSPEELDTATITGGGAAEASTSTPMAIDETPAPFGPAPGSIVAATSTDQAGGHANFTTAFAMTTDEPNSVAGDVRDIRFDLPPGLVGSTVGMQRCTMGQVLSLQFVPNACPSDTMVGAATLTLSLGGAVPGEITLVTPVYNIAPAPGEPAAFALEAIFLPVRFDTSVLSNGDYGVRVTAPGVSQAAVTLAGSVTIWGVPADHSGPGNDQSIMTLLSGGPTFGGPDAGATRVALLSNPQRCSEGLSASMSADSWPAPNVFVPSESVPVGPFTGCDRLSLDSSFALLPDTLQAGAPAGYTFDLAVPQDTSPDGLATPNVKNVELMLPAGTVVSPSAANGLVACSNTQFALHSGLPGTCPRAAQVGEVEIETPALPLPLDGELYLAEPECDPCTPEDAADGKMIRLFLQAVGKGESGVVVKLEGRGEINQRTGQVAATFANNPQLPFSELRLALSGGSRATLANPRSCGSASSSLDLTPWSAPFTPDSRQSYSFEVNQSCFGPQFNPSFVAGLTNLQAGAYGPFTLSLSRGDHDQFLGELELRMPPGVLGKLSALTPCREPQASQGACGPESLIGHVQTLVGAGSTPYLVAGGEIFLTEGYKGAPFGLSIVVPAVAGPYTLAGTTGKGAVIVRATVSVDPKDAHLTIKSDPLPSSLDGIPLQVKVIDATIDRPEFVFGPTNCSRLAVAGTLGSSEGATAAVSSPFQVANCATLPFRPRFTALTRAKASKAGGASLHVKVVSGPGQANIAKVEVNLPKQLPSRLTTLQKACLAAVFETNPANCPAGSVVGTGTAVTPVLKNILTGPAYLVSHAGASFPNLVIVLQGEGITLEEIGTTDIKRGITSSTFNSVPDAPISTFDLVLPEGPHAVLAAYLPAKAKYSMCGQSLAMPTEITGQNGAVVKQTTKIAVAGCRRHGRARRAKAHGNARRATRWRAQIPERGLPSGHLSTAPGGTPSSPLL